MSNESGGFFGSDSADVGSDEHLESAMQSCPNCPDQGWYAMPNHYTGELEQVQCEFCYANPNSVFNSGIKTS